jgi:hypothetical protein
MPVGRGEGVVIDSGGFIVSEKPAVAVCVPLSALTVKLEVPTAVGYPLITPALDKFRPAGNVPDWRDQV